MNIGTYVGEITTTPEEGYRGGQCMELLSVVSV
jgi:hypothetical protein